jgi:nucleotide-binding universal stress UspA family protein
MKRFHHIVAYLSLNDSDATVLAWVSNIARLADASRISLVHAWRPVDIPQQVIERYPWLLEPGVKVAEERIEKLRADHLSTDAGVAVDVVVHEGNALGELLRVLLDTDADLVVCGRDGEDVYLSEKLARKAPCSLLTVPANASTEFKRVLAALDYSSYSRKALDVARAFAESGKAGLTIFHAFAVHWGQSRSTIPREEFVKDLKSFHEERLRTLAASLDLHGVEPEIHLRESALPPAAIARAVNEENHDLVTIGCRGHDAIYATLLGSTAEEILRTCPVPVVAVKKKASTKSFLAALRNH